jgi:hypothetical protein
VIAGKSLRDREGGREREGMGSFGSQRNRLVFVVIEFVGTELEF